MAKSKLKKVLSIALVGLMLTPIVSFATNDTSQTTNDTSAESTTTTDSTAGTTTGTTTGQTGGSGVVKKETGVGFIDKTRPDSLQVEGLTQEAVDDAVDYLIASTADRRKMAYQAATEKPAADKSLEGDDVFDADKVIDGHMLVTASEAYELYVEPESFSIMIRDKNTGTLIRSTLEDEEAYVRCTQQPTFSMLTSGITIVPIKYDPNVESRSGMYDKSNLMASSRDATITYDKKENGLVAHLKFDNHKNDLSLKGLNIEFDVELTLDESGLDVKIPEKSINENYKEKELCFMMGDVYLFPLFGYTDRGDTEGYMILPDGNGIIVNYADFYQDGTAKYKGGYSARVYGSDISYDVMAAASEEQEREDFNPVEEIIAPYFGMVHDYSSLNEDSHEKDIAVLGLILKGEQSSRINGIFNGVNSVYENYAYASAIYREIYQQPTDNSSGSSKTEASGMQISDYEQVFLLSSGEEANYSGLANECRDLLLEKGILTKDKDTDYDVRLDFLGLDKENFLLFRRNVVATTVSNVETIIEKLKKNGVDDISAYYDGWQKGGMYNLPNKDFKVDSDLGGNNDMKNLVKKYKDSSVSISLLQNVLEINDITSNSTFTAVKMVNKRTFSYTDRFLNVYQTFKYLTPEKANEYIKTIANNFSKNGFDGVAYSGFSNTLFAYSLNNKLYSREDAMKYYTSALKEVKKKNMRVALEEPSMYLWQYTDEFMNMPLGSSMYVYASEEIPFLTSVLKGSMKVYSEYVNYEANQTEFFLKLVESGVYPSFLLTYQSPTVLQYTNSSWDYSSAYEQYLEVIGEFNSELKSLNEKTEGAYIQKHESNYDDIAKLNKVTYSNGVVIYVNFSEDTVSADGTTIDGLSYVVSYVDKVGEK